MIWRKVGRSPPSVSGGVLVEPDDEDVLERAIAIGPELAGDPCRRRSARFSLTAMVAAYEGVYRIVTRALV